MRMTKILKTKLDIQTGITKNFASFRQKIKSYIIMNVLVSTIASWYWKKNPQKITVSFCLKKKQKKTYSS